MSAAPRFRLVPLDARDLARLQDLLVRCDDFHALTHGLATRADEAERLLAERPPRFDARYVLGVVLDGEGERLAGVLEGADGYPEPGVAWIGLLLLDPAARGGGLGAAVLAEFERGARARGARELQLAVVEQNPRARAFWERAGFAWLREGRQEAPALVNRCAVLRKPLGPA